MEITKSKINDIVDKKIDSFINDRRLKDKMREITIGVLEDFYNEMWHKRSFWSSQLKK